MTPESHDDSRGENLIRSSWQLAAVVSSNCSLFPFISSLQFFPSAILEKISILVDCGRAQLQLNRDLTPHASNKKARGDFSVSRPAVSRRKYRCRAT